LEIDGSLAVVLEMLRFLYRGEVESLEDVAMPLYEMAEEFELEDLKGLCLNHMQTNVTLENVAHLFAFAKEHKIPSLDRKAKNFFSA
jgi:hypothetical protein